MKKLYPVTGNPWVDNKRRYVERATHRLSKPILVQHSDGGRMAKREKDEYREVIQPLVRETIANMLRDNRGL